MFILYFRVVLGRLVISVDFSNWFEDRYTSRNFVYISMFFLYTLRAWKRLGEKDLKTIAASLLWANSEKSVENFAS